jgi:hypothetical protein
MLERKEVEAGSEEASAARYWAGEGLHFPFKSRLWAAFGRIILYHNVKACLFASQFQPEVTQKMV